MALDLDERQRAMLEHMGIRVWAQPTGAAKTPTPTHAPVRTSAPTLAPVPVPGPAPASVVAPPNEALLQPTSHPTGVGSMDWTALRSAVAGCQACGLCRTRRNTVFGVGAERADWMIVGEAPGESEDLQGEPFVGQAGKLLDNMLRAIGLDRTHDAGGGVFIANVLKCRPPGNRNPEPGEIAQCEPFLKRQVALVQPRIILAMGRFAVQSLLQTTEPIGKLRGRVHQYQGVPLVVTYHPAYLLRNLPDKAKAWADLVLAMQVMRGAAGGM